MTSNNLVVPILAVGGSCFILLEEIAELKQRCGWEDGPLWLRVLQTARLMQIANITYLSSGQRFLKDTELSTELQFSSDVPKWFKRSDKDEK